MKLDNVSIRIGLAQIDPTVGDFQGNARMILEFVERALESEVDLVVFPELALSGYPPEDLLLKAHFLEESRDRLNSLLPAFVGITAVVGCPLESGGVRNAAAVINDGELAFEYYKRELPNYGVFDEKRYFKPGTENPLFDLGGALFGVSVCEDVWVPGGPPVEQAGRGARLLVNISASPFYAGKSRERAAVLGSTASDAGAYVAYCNLVGGQDELVFDGRSLVMDPGGRVMARAKSFEQDLLVVDIPLEAGPGNPAWTIALGPLRFERKSAPAPQRLEDEPGQVEEVYEALLLGLRDYAHKNGFERAVLGLSGGIDSSLTAVLACDALGPENVTGVSMPSEVSSRESVEDARLLASNLGISLLEIPIARIQKAYLAELGGAFGGLPADVAEENLQARIRGNLLMALSNKFGWLLLSTGNKSEMSVGYATLYGDMAGGLAVLKDVPKTLVYRLSRYRNDREGRPLIPESVLTREPSAELAPGQKDTDRLPPYEVLDPILNLYIEEDMSVEQIEELGHDPGTVRYVASLVDGSEYKRRQSPPGIKITPRAFGRDRRMPITSLFRPFRAGPAA